jgi:hypothetical protein
VLGLLGALVLPAAAAAAVPAGVTKGLDYLHAHECADGGFSYANTSGNALETPWVVLAIAAGGNSPARWKSGESSPIAFLKNTNLVTAAANSGNAPEYYAMCILAYRAANRTDLLSSAGSSQIDLVSKLESYQYGNSYYSPTVSSTLAAATETTAWAVLGLAAANRSGSAVSGAVTWLEDNPNTKSDEGAGGFGSQPDSQSSTTVTSLVIQALVRARVSASSAVVQNAAGFITTMQRSSGGFWDTDGGYANAPSTAWAIEGLRAAGVTKPVRDGRTFLTKLRQKNGSYYEFYDDIGDVMNATIQATIALTGKWLPITGGPRALTHFDPTITSGSVVPKNGARFPSATVLIKAAYHDNANGTGVKAKAVGVTVDGKSKTKAAHITASRLRLQLTKLAGGSHTFVITVRDWAGNSARIRRSFTVAIPTSGSSSTGGGTHAGSSSGSGTSSSGSGGHVHHTVTPTHKATIAPTQTTGSGITPTPTPSSSFPAALASPSSTASVTGRVAGSGGSGGGGHTAALVGTSLAVLLPLGFAGSWLMRRRLMGVMGGATRGETLPRGTSVWQRFWKSSGGPPTAGGGE